MARHSTIRATLALLLLAPGCASSPRTLDAALLDYQSGRYADARTHAADLARTGGGGAQRDAARYLAGLSAYRLGDLDDAERHLSLAARSRDEAVAAKAQAMIGLVELARGRPLLAAAALDAAAPRLSASDAESARRKAAEARGAAGIGATGTEAGGGSAAAPEPAARGPGPYALQVGAFAERSRAERAAREVRPAAVRAGLGKVRIAPDTDERGRRLYFVQLGRFQSWSDAQQARASLQRDDLLVTALRD